MINISDYSKFFIKSSFNLETPKYKKIKKPKPTYDYLFYAIFHKINTIHTSGLYQYNEIQEKVKLSEHINNIKIKKKEYILNNLMYEKNIDLITLNAIVKYYNKNLIYVQDKICFKMIYNDELPILFINEKYNFVDNVDYNTLYEIINLEKPLNSISYYKLTELSEIANKINIHYEKIKKVDLYNSIYNYLVKLNIFKID